MKIFIVTILVLFLNNTSFAQMIKSFECTKTHEADSSFIIYSLKVQFNSNTTDSIRLNLIKMELHNRYEIDADNIIIIQSWLGKRYRTFLFTVKVKSILQKEIEIEQIQTQSPNPNDDEMLSTQEAELLNSLIEQSRNTFDFHGKKIAFITGSSGSRILSKADYFNTCVNPWLDDGKTPQIFMVELTGEEKNKSGGYDAFVLSWVKVFTDKRKRKVIEQLSKK